MTIKAFITKFTPSFLLKIYHYKLALSAAILFWFPSKNLTVIGVTGTSGKSTTVDFITRILEEPFDSAQGRSVNKVASLSSIRFKIGEKEWKNELKMTMPGRFKLQKFLKQAKKAGCKYVVLEVTSQGIEQYRHKFINFKTAVFTNLSPEHIESHGGFENYRNAKLKLFKVAKNNHIVNLDDLNSEHFLKIKAKENWGYGFKDFGSRLPDSNFKTVFADNILESANGLKFSVENIEFNLNFLGRFNVYNALAAICVGLSEGVSLDFCKIALEKAKGIAGRMEVVAEKPFAVIVDYAHTPEQLENVYKTFSTNYSLPAKNLICVLGSCGGGRDKWKRPVLGKLAKQFCGKIIITNEDPYDEDPQKIIDEVASGAGERAEKILDRREAISYAIKSADPNNIVIITGKGSEPWMCVEKGKKIPWDDRKIAKEEFEKSIN